MENLSKEQEALVKELTNKIMKEIIEANEANGADGVHEIIDKYDLGDILIIDGEELRVNDKRTNN